MFKILFAAAGILLSLAGIYIYLLVRRTGRFYLSKINRSKTVRKSAKWIEELSYIAAAILIVFVCFKVWDCGIACLLYLIAFAMIADIMNLIFKKILKGNLQHMWRTLYGSSVIPTALTAFMMIYGIWNMGRAVQTDYIVETDKKIREEGYRVVLITDIHYGTIQDESVVREAVEMINEEKPDVIILGGDIVEEGTTKEKMQEAFALFGTLEAEMGVYYVYGNHDKQLYSSDRAYSESELQAAIKENGIVILEDEVKDINGEILLVGRNDRSLRNRYGRKSMNSLLADADKTKFILTADHQPVDTAENNEAGVDLLVSGHTHAGQLWPGEFVLNLTGELAYGEYQEGKCKVIVSSGLTGWGFPVRTSQHCEYVMIQIQSK